MRRTDYEALMLEDLERSGLDEDDAESLRRVAYSPVKTRKVTGNRRYEFASYKISYFSANGKQDPDFFRLRTLDPKRGFGKDGSQKYWQPFNSPPRLYLPPYVDWTSVQGDVKTKLLITEGEKKADAACKSGIPACALGGAFQYASKKRGIELLEELVAFKLEGRIIELAYDGDHGSNSHVAMGMERLARLLSERGAEVHILKMPLNLKLDDLLVKHGYQGFMDLPRVPFDTKSIIRNIRNMKGPPHVRNQRIADTCQRTILASGTAHRVGSEPVIFDGTEHRLYSYLTHDSSQLRAYFSERMGINPSEHEYRYVFEQLRGHIMINGTETEAPLFGHFDREDYALQLSVGDSKVIRITRSGIENVLNGHADVLFRDGGVQPFEIDETAHEDAFAFIMDLPNFEGTAAMTYAQQVMLYELHCWSLIFSSYLKAYPILLLNGRKGSAKTTGGRAIGISIFGPDFDVTSVDPKRLSDLDTALIHRPLLVLDNLDGKIPGLENQLATAATGGKISRRILYTTAENIEFPIRARIIATSRSPDVFVRDDVRDRTIFLSVARRKEFRTEEGILKKVANQRGRFWAHVLAMAPKIIAALEDHKPKARKERLADFAQFCLAVGPVVGYSRKQVDAALTALEHERNAFAGSQGSLLDSLRRWANKKWFKQRRKAVNDRLIRRMSTGDLFEEVRFVAGQHFTFHSPITFGRALSNELEMLSEHFDLKLVQGHAGATYAEIRPKFPITNDGAEDIEPESGK